MAKVNIFQEFHTTVLNNPDKTAIVYQKDNIYNYISYSLLYKLSLKIAKYLYEKNIGRNDLVAIILPNSPLWYVSFMGILARGSIVVPINPLLEKESIEEIILHAEPKLIITSLEFQKNLENINCPLLLLNHKDLEEVEDIKEDLIIDNKNNKEEDIAVINYTSGTTGNPKGVVLTHKNLLANYESLIYTKCFSNKDSIITLLPLYHSYPLMINLITSLLIGATVALPPSLEGKDILKCLRDNNITVLIGVPRLFYLFHKHIRQTLESNFIKRIFINIIVTPGYIIRRLLKWNINKLVLRKLHRAFGTRLRFCVSGGAKLDNKVLKDFFKWGFTVLEGYGLTETSPVVTFNTIYEFKLGSVGKPLHNVEIKIWEPNKEGIGEIIIRGDNVFKEYYKNPQLTAQVKKENWFYSGDLGYIDKRGFLYIKGRKKEVIVLSSGKKIFPDEIENYYLKSPFIEELCVVTKDEEHLSAIIKPNWDKLKKEGFTNIKDKIRWEIELISHKLPSYKRIHNYIIVDTNLPKTSLGKLKRHEITNILASEIIQVAKEKKNYQIKIKSYFLKNIVRKLWIF